MKALTIHAPWAWAIAHAGKTIENRSWPTAHRGRIAIHAGYSKASDQEAAAMFRRLGIEWPDEYERGAIVAAADVIDVVSAGDASVDGNPWAEGPLCWRLANIRPLAIPVPCSGALSLWDVPSEIAVEVEYMLRESVGVQ